MYVYQHTPSHYCIYIYMYLTFAIDYGTHGCTLPLLNESNWSLWEILGTYRTVMQSYEV